MLDYLINAEKVITGKFTQSSSMHLDPVSFLLEAISCTMDMLSWSETLSMHAGGGICQKTDSECIVFKYDRHYDDGAASQE